MPSFVVHIPLPPKNAGANPGNKNWRPIHRARKHQRRDAHIAGLAAKPKDWTHQPIIVDVEFYGFRLPHQNVYVPRDIPNAWYSLKGAFDGLVDAGIIPDDSKEWLDTGACVIYSKAKDHKGKSCVLLTIRTAGEDA